MGHPFVHLPLGGMLLSPMLVHIRTGPECLRAIRAFVQIRDARMNGGMLTQHRFRFEPFVAHQTLVRRLTMREPTMRIQGACIARHIRALIARNGRPAVRMIQLDMTLQAARMLQPFAALRTLAPQRFGAMLDRIM